MAGSRAVDAREPGQVREEAALSESVHAPRIGLAGAESRRARSRARFDDGCTVHTRYVAGGLRETVFCVLLRPEEPHRQAAVGRALGRAGGALAAAALVAALQGCGEKVVDTDKVEALVRDGSANKQLIRSVECPDDVKAEKGATFDCTLRIRDGSEEKVTIRQIDDDGTVRVAGNRQVRLGRDPRKVRIKAENAERLIQGNSQKPLDSIRCPDGVRLRRGASFDCTVVGADGSRGVVTIVQTDDVGNLRIAKVRRAGR